MSGWAVLGTAKPVCSPQSNTSKNTQKSGWKSSVGCQDPLSASIEAKRIKGAIRVDRRHRVLPGDLRDRGLLHPRAVQAGGAEQAPVDLVERVGRVVLQLGHVLH